MMVYSPLDMKGISPNVIGHKLNIKRETRSVKQRKRNFTPDRKEVIKEKVNKLLDAGFISEVMYPDWLTNDMLVKNSKQEIKNFH